MKGAAHAAGAVYPDMSTVRFHQPFGKRESQAGAFVATAMGSIHLAEFDKNTVHIFCAHADAGVGNRQVQPHR